MSNFKIRKVFILALALFMLGACARTNAVEMGKQAMDFSLTDTEGKKVNLTDFKGKVIILDFFASWCPPCRMEIPDFVELQKAYGPDKFTMVGVSLTDARDTKDFAAKSGINYPVLIDDGKASAVYGPIRSIPTTFILDKDFKVVKMYIGYQPKNVFEDDIKELLK
jgi:peroxiredoxin